VDERNPSVDPGGHRGLCCAWPFAPRCTIREAVGCRPARGSTRMTTVSVNSASARLALGAKAHEAAYVPRRGHT
jgi:hypothetical protein